MESWTRTVLLFLVISLSDAQEVKKNLKGTEGGTITLPDPLLERGYLLYGRKNIADLKNRELEIVGDIYMNRLHWNNITGLFTLTDLQRTDSGIYTIQSIKGKGFTTFYSITVYGSVAPPTVHTLSVSSASCSLLCAVDDAAEITLWWYKDQEVVNQSSSAGSLPLTVTKQDLSSSYRCVAGNPAEEKTLLVDLQRVCGLNFTSSAINTENTESRHHWIIGVSTLGAVLVVLAAVFIKWKFFSQNKRTTTESGDSAVTKQEVEYAEVQICPDRRSQGGNLQDSSGSVDRSNLTTVYDRLEVHRMMLPHSDANIS